MRRGVLSQLHLNPQRQTHQFLPLIPFPENTNHLHLVSPIKNCYLNHSHTHTIVLLKFLLVLSSCLPSSVVTVLIISFIKICSVLRIVAHNFTMQFLSVKPYTSKWHCKWYNVPPGLQYSYKKDTEVDVIYAWCAECSKFICETGFLLLSLCST